MTGQTHANRTLSVRLSAILLSAVFGAGLMTASPAAALSELRKIPGAATVDDERHPAEKPAQRTAPSPIPMPDPLVNKTPPDTLTTQEPDDELEPQDDAPVEVLSDVSKIPEPVARMRELIVEAAASGDIERLRPLLGKGPTETQVSVSENDDGDDAVATLKGLSGDPDGIEILAILLDVMSTGFVQVDKGTPNEMFVWPYFAEKPLATLTKPEKVDLFRLVTAGDFAGMQEFGSYNFYRVGITPDGQWKFFVAGD